MNESSAHHYGELVALDRSLGQLRQFLRQSGLEKNTMLVFCSDNGGLPDVQPSSVGGLRGNKGTVYEGGLRVPGIIEWPAVITRPRVTYYPACTMDLLPTVVDLLQLPSDCVVEPIDGRSLKPLLTAELAERDKPIPFRYRGKLAWVDNRYKMICDDPKLEKFQLYDLVNDPSEGHDIGAEKPELYRSMKAALLAWNASVDRSFEGKDYPEGKLSPPDLPSVSWTTQPDYQAFLPQWQQRWEYRSLSKPKAGNSKKQSERKK